MAIQRSPRADRRDHRAWDRRSRRTAAVSPARPPGENRISDGEEAWKNHKAWASAGGAAGPLLSGPGRKDHSESESEVPAGDAEEARASSVNRSGGR
jgi:hypothetical protein